MVKPLITGDIRANVIPAVDLDLQSDTSQPLKLYDDIEAVLSLITVMGPTSPKLLRGSSLGDVGIVNLPDPGSVLGSEANVANAQVFGGAGNTASFDTQGQPFLSIFGHVSAAVTLTIQFSADNVTFYASGTTIVLAGASDYGININPGARFIRVNVSAAVTITCTMQATG